MTRPHAQDRRPEDADLARQSAQPGCIAAAWILVALIVFIAFIGPAAARLIEIALVTTS